MEVTIGKEGLKKTYQNDFPETATCCSCSGEARIGFVAHEGLSNTIRPWKYVYDLHFNAGRGNLWLHDACAVAIYFCKECLETTALYNQG